MELKYFFNLGEHDKIHDNMCSHFHAESGIITWPRFVFIGLRPLRQMERNGQFIDCLKGGRRNRGALPGQSRHLVTCLIHGGLYPRGEHGERLYCSYLRSEALLYRTNQTDNPPFSPMNSAQIRSSRTFRQKQIPSNSTDFRTTT